jgi:outer membrane protein assembly factor BamB
MYGADFKGSLVKRDGVTGREVWTFDPEGEFASEGPAVGPRYAYVVVRDDSQQEFVSAVDRERGAEAWRVRLPVPEAPPGVSAPLRPSSLYTGGFPVLSGGRLYLPRFDDDNDLLFLYALG